MKIEKLKAATLCAAVALAAALASCNGNHGSNNSRNNIGDISKDTATAHAVAIQDSASQSEKGAVAQRQCTRIARHKAVSHFFSNAKGDSLAVGGARLAVPAGAMSHGMILSITPLEKNELPHLPAGMVNVTGGEAMPGDTVSGYRFLPHGNHFCNIPARITVPYDSTLIPKGYTAADIHTYYYDEMHGKWTMLKHKSTDKHLATVTAETTHFTDVINGIIKVPESPETSNYVPTGISDLKAADPSAGIQQIEAPTANQNGTAALAYQFAVPEGRAGISAGAGLQYSSDGGSGFVGYGWSLPVQSIDIETRWGVPRFDSENESESYLLAGKQLSDRHYRKNGVQKREKDKRFYPMVEGGFSKIVRKGSTPEDYYWEVTDKNGTVYSYGGHDGMVSDESTLSDGNNHRIRWALDRVTDVHGNFAAFHYIKSGNNLYPAKYTWTGFGNEEGVYSIEFEIDTESSDRNDVVRNGRLGVMQTDKALLRKVVVKNDGKQLRAYKPNYEVGPFGKTLLKSIDQLDSKDAFVASQSFDYYNDVEKGMFGDSIIKYTAESDNYGRLVKHKIGHFDERLSLLGGGSSNGSTMGTGGMVGAGWGPASINVGPSFSYTKSKNEGRIVMIDINGDGLPDKLWKGSDGRLHYRLNQNLDLKTPTFGETNDIAGIRSFSSGSSNSFTMSANFATGFGPASVGYSTGKTTEESATQTYLMDFNNDGLIDIASNGTVYFNHSDGKNVYFSKTSAETGNPIISTDAIEIDSSFVPNYDAIRDSLEKQFPLHDVVRLWRAPYKGTIIIESVINKPSAEGDGVTLSMQKNNSILWKESLKHGSLRTPNKEVKVNAGDYILFRAGAVYSGTGDEIQWNPTITYKDILTENVAGYDIAHYNSSTDYIDGVSSSVTLLNDGLVNYEGTYSKEKTSDDIVLALLKTDKDGVTTQIDSLFIPADSVVNGEFKGTYKSVAEEGATIDFVIKAESQINWKKINWSPVVTCDTVKYTISPQRLMFNKNIRLNADSIQNVDLTVADETWQEGFTITPILNVGRSADKDTDPAQVYMTIKDDSGNLLFKRRLTLSSKNKIEGQAITIKDSDLAEKLSKKKMQVEFSIMNELSSCSNAGINFYRDSIIYKTDTAGNKVFDRTESVLVANIPASVYSSFNRFDYGPLYRGWGQFAWNGSSSDGIKTDEMKVSDNDKYIKDGEVDKEAMENSYDDINGQKFFAMSYKIESGMYISATDSAFVSSEFMRPSRLGEDAIVIDSIDYNMLADGLCAPVQKTSSKTKNHSENAGISIGVSIGVDKSSANHETYSVVSAMDINGDGYPDWLYDNNGSVIAQLTSATGSLSKDRLRYHASMSRYEGEDSNTGANIGLSSNPADYSLSKFTESFKEAKLACIRANTSEGSQNLAAPDGTQAASSGSSIEGACGAGGNYSNGSSETICDWNDLNGDGLPDMVSKGFVKYNLGYGFTDEIPTGLGQIGKTVNSNYGDGLGLSITVLGTFGISMGKNDGESLNFTTGGLYDVNGDGLPDYVSQNDDKSLSVMLNTGLNFTDPSKMGKEANIESSIGSSIGYYANTSYTYTIPLPFGFKINITTSSQSSSNESISRTTSSLRDMDGDGLPDIVYSNDDNVLFVRRNLTGRTNMLKAVTLPFGGRITIGYEQTTPSYDHPGRKWVMSSVETTGGYEENGATSGKNTFEYSGGYKHRQERDFFGFRTVRTNQLDTEHDDRLFRYSVQTYGNNRDYYTHDLVTAEALYDAEGRMLQGSTYEYDLRKVSDEVRFPALASVVQTTFDETSGESMSTKVMNDYDALGNLTVCNETAAGYELDAAIEYHNKGDRYIVGVPKHIKVGCKGVTLRERSTEIDNLGNITKIEMSAGDKPSVYNIDYDDYGNILKLTKPENYRGQRMWHSYTYDDRLHSLVTKVEDAYGYSSSTEYDDLWNAPKATTDLNGERMEYEYDDLGRPTVIRAPYEIASGEPFTIKYEYEPAYMRAHTIHFSPDGNIDTYTFADSLGRAVQTKRTGSVWNASAKKAEKMSIVSGRVVTDAFGRKIATYYPVAESFADIAKYNASTGSLQARTEYDSRDRALSVTLADGAKTTSDYTIVSHDGEQMLLTRVTDALGRTSESYTDEKGRNRQTVQHGESEDVVVRYDYDAVGQVVAVHHPNGTQTTYKYDLLGRKLSVKHPDAGEVVCTYDAAGNLLTKLTAELKKSISDKAPITYTYDYERLSEVLYPENLFNRVTYTYGEAGDDHGRAGRLALVEDASGGEAYYYGKMGEVVKTVRTVMASVADIRTYVYGAEYDSWNRVRKMTYPDGEVVTYHYDEAGQVYSLTSNKNGSESVIVDRIGYDKDGHTVYTKLGNGTETEYTYDDARQRLQEMKLAFDGSDIMHNKYSYDAVDNILGIANTVNPQELSNNSAKLGGESSHTYQYDALNRLISASGKAKDASYTLDMAYNVMSMPVSKAQTVENSSKAASYTNMYKYEDADHPTAPSQIGHEHYTYDANGNPVRVENDSTDATREMYWDEDNRLMVLSDNGKTSRYTYNHAGERVVKSHGSMEGVYINGAPQGITFHETDEYTLYPASILSVTKNRFTKHYFIGSKRVASRIGSGSFNNMYGVNGSHVTAGQQDYAERLSQIESQKEDYYKKLGIAPGIPTMKGSYADPENTGVGYNTIIKELGDHSVPAEWAQYVKKNEQEGTAPGAPIAWDDPSDPDEAQPGYGFVADSSSEEEETYFFHSDHLGSTSYITDKDGNITQYDAYLPYGELLVDEHSSSEEMPYKFNGKEFDEETGLYYYGARYMNPVASIWYGVDPLAEKYVEISGYVYCHGNPIRLIDPDGNADKESTSQKENGTWAKIRSCFDVTFSVGMQVGLKVGKTKLGVDFGSANAKCDLNGNIDYFRSSGLSFTIMEASYEYKNEYRETTTTEKCTVETLYQPIIFSEPIKTGSHTFDMTVTEETVKRTEDCSIGCLFIGFSLFQKEDNFKQKSCFLGRSTVEHKTKNNSFLNGCTIDADDVRNELKPTNKKTEIGANFILGLKLGVDFHGLWNIISNKEQKNDD